MIGHWPKCHCSPNTLSRKQISLQKFLELCVVAVYTKEDCSTKWVHALDTLRLQQVSSWYWLMNRGTVLWDYSIYVSYISFIHIYNRDLVEMAPITCVNLIPNHQLCMGNALTSRRIPRILSSVKAVLNLLSIIQTSLRGWIWLKIYPFTITCSQDWIILATRKLCNGHIQNDICGVR